MRLIEVFKSEKEVFLFSSFLKKEGIKNAYERKGQNHFALWIEDEDDLDIAKTYLQRYQENPSDPIFKEVPLTPPLETSTDKIPESLPPLVVVKQKRFRFRFTHLVLLLCVFLFLWNDAEEAEVLAAQGPIGLKLRMVPLQTHLLFDFPKEAAEVQKIVSEYPLKNYQTEKDFPEELQAQMKEAEKIPTFQGISSFFKTPKAPLFEKIREGEVWRLFTPALLHTDFLHILFNMIWVWIVLPQIEVRLKLWKLCLLILFLGVGANVAQYLMSGPFFLGFSGVVVGLVGFIWMRQKKAPWEGYPLNRSTILFLWVFVLSMVALEGLSFFLELFALTGNTLPIANTAHVVGGLLGMLCGRSRFFERGSS